MRIKRFHNSIFPHSLSHILCNHPPFIFLVIKLCGGIPNKHCGSAGTCFSPLRFQSSQTHFSDTEFVKFHLFSFVASYGCSDKPTLEVVNAAVNTFFWTIGKKEINFVPRHLKKIAARLFQRQFPIVNSTSPKYFYLLKIEFTIAIKRFGILQLPLVINPLCNEKRTLQTGPQGLNRLNGQTVANVFHFGRIQRRTKNDLDFIRQIEIINDFFDLSTLLNRHTRNKIMQFRIVHLLFS